MRRKGIPRELQVRIFCRDKWLCRCCSRPVIFPASLKYLLRYARQQGYTGPLAWFSFAWRRDASPLLDELGAVVDHVKAFSADREHDPRTTSRQPAQGAMSERVSSSADEFRKKHPLRRIRGKYGEPLHWDGLSTLFVLFVRQDATGVTRAEMEWYEALRKAAATAPDPANHAISRRAGGAGTPDAARAP
jgi:hypothetical protein